MTNAVKIDLACPICTDAGTPIFSKANYQILECSDCRHRFTHPCAEAQQHVDSAYGDDYFLSGGAGYSDYPADERLRRDHGRRYAAILNRVTSPGRILDVGAAAGFILQGFIDGGWTGKGIEPNDSMASIARSRLGLEVLTGMLENLAIDEEFDLVSMIQVLPHFIDPRHAMSVVSKAIRPGGLLLIETWNRSSWTARLFGESWHEYSPPSVLHWFDPAGVSRLAGDFGLTEVSRGRPTKRISAAHAKSLIRHKLGHSSVGRFFSRLMDVCPDRVTIPYPAEDLFWMLLRKDILAT